MVRRVGVDGANYRAIEYTGELVEQMSVSERFTFCNMAIEMGGKAGLVAPDATTRAWLHGRIDHSYAMLAPDNPSYERIVEIDASQLSPLIACPPDVNNVVPVEEVERVKIDQVFLGTCTNGRLDDLAIAANIMRGKTLHPQTRMVVVPASREIYLEAMRLGSSETLDVVVLSNEHGDILADVASGSIGDLGLSPSACFGERYAYFEPVHGSAPDLVGKGIINPTAMLLSGAMMLAYLGYSEQARRLEHAIEQVYSEGIILNSDQGGSASTMEFVEAVVESVGSMK